MKSIFDKSICLHTGYYSEDAVKAFELMFDLDHQEYVIGSSSNMYVQKSIYSIYDSKYILRAPDGEICCWYYWEIMEKDQKKVLDDFLKISWKRLLNLNKMFQPKINVYLMSKNMDRRTFNDALCICNGGTIGLIGRPFIDQFKISALEALYSELEKTVEKEIKGAFEAQQILEEDQIKQRIRELI